MNNSIKIYQNLCSIIRNTFDQYDIIIAGGCIRDTLNDAPVKDVDTFIYMPTVADVEGMDSPYAKGCKALAKYLNAPIEFREPSPDYPNIFDICDITSPKYGVIQLIGIDRIPMMDVKNYDFGLSQVFVTSKDLFMTLQCHKDMENRTITFTPSDRSPKAMVRSQKRYFRLKEKYPCWTFVNCEELEKMNYGPR